MSNKWSKEEKAIWSDSEVMQEFEKRILDVISRADILSDKIAAVTPDDNQVMQGMSASEKGEYMSAKNSNQAEDAEYNEEYDPEDGLVEFNSESDDGWDKEAMVLKLREITKNATDRGLYSLAYKIERTIDEIIEN